VEPAVDREVLLAGGIGTSRWRFGGLDPGVIVSRDTVARETAEGVNLAKNLGVVIFYRFEVDLFNIKILKIDMTRQRPKFYSDSSTVNVIVNLLLGQSKLY